ncbi:hypothetical protein [Tellurirhabdus rosea]|uniref:hypothetical protein n=1 Tax=Tellurirhabdus rosea TaxID=2674997 RepID=UPI00224D3C2D|nr:hypothetical protein [Tellurirhabdus rosea]
MNKLLTLICAALLTIAATACSALKSDLTVRPGKQFELGGNRNGAFTAQVRNVGSVAVQVTERLADGRRVSLGTFGPGDQKTIRFAAGSAALIDNTASKPARLLLVVTGDKDLSMSELGR